MAFQPERKEMQWLLEYTHLPLTTTKPLSPKQVPNKLEYTHLPLNLHKIFDERLCKRAPLSGASD